MPQFQRCRTQLEPFFMYALPTLQFRIYNWPELVLKSVRMISFILLSVFVLTGAEQFQEEGAVAQEGQRVLTNAGYMIRFGGSLYRYPGAFRILPPAERNPTETNEIDNGEDDKRRPLFFFTSHDAEERSPEEGLPTSRPYIEIRRKRDVDAAAVPESSKIGKLRKKRTYCGKCGGGGGYGGYYVPVTYAVYPVYYGGYGKGGKGCNTCGGGRGGGYGGGYGGGGSYSYSQSSASSSAGSFGWGKK